MLNHRTTTHTFESIEIRKLRSVMSISAGTCTIEAGKGTTAQW